MSKRKHLKKQNRKYKTTVNTVECSTVQCSAVPAGFW